MTHNQTFRRFLTTMLISVSLFGESLKARPRIAALENESEAAAHVTGYPRNYTVSGSHKKQFSLPVFIPFVSIDKYRDEFLAGEPYFPAEAITITTKRGKYGIWRDETGIVYALKHAPGIARNDCIPMTLFKKGAEASAENIIQSLVLLVTINKQGDLTISEG